MTQQLEAKLPFSRINLSLQNLSLVAIEILPFRILWEVKQKICATYGFDGSREICLDACYRNFF